MDVQPYLFFDGRCEEALEFYKKTLGAEVKVLLRFKDNPEPQPGMTPPGAENKDVARTRAIAKWPQR